MEPVRYTVRFPEPHTHYAEVEAVLPAEGPALEVFMAVWTPGSYLVREYARHVEGLTAEGGDGASLPVVKSRKNRWLIDTGGSQTVRLAYRVYCREMSVRTNWVEDGFAFLNGAPTFVAQVGGLHRPHEVTVELPPRWKTSITGLPEIQGTVPHRYLAQDYDALVDSPILIGNPAVSRFEVDGIPHFLAAVGEDGLWDSAKAVAAFERIVRHYRAMWGSLPYEKYVCLNLIVEAGGGLEHCNSMVLMASRWAMRTRRAWVGWMSLASHEFFHVWNVKRLRPVELGPFDYENENYTRSLWVAEGITDYYAPLTLHRAGLIDAQEYLSDTEARAASLSAVIGALQTTPGRLVVSTEQASYDAWIKAYRPDENSQNTTISYYTKGTVVAWLLDARLRRATGGVKSLDDLMRLLFARYSGERGFSSGEFKTAAEEVAGVGLAGFFRKTVESTEELDYTEALDWFGLRFRLASDGEGKAWLGAETKVDNGRLLISRVVRGTPAFQAGLDMDDEILGLGEFRVRADQLGHRLEQYRPGERLSVLVARREKLVRIEVVLGEEPGKKWGLELRPERTAAQRANLAAWLR